MSYYICSYVKAGQVDSLFPISHFLNFDAGGRSLLIIDYVEVIQPGAIHTCFSWQTIQKAMS